MPLDATYDEVICIVGPTASGKTDVAQCLCESLNGEILTADSMQVYRGMDIGTGKMPFEERTVAHHGLDLVDPGEPYSAALYQAYGRDVVKSVQSEGRICVVAGGTGLYVKSLIDDYDFPTGQDDPDIMRVRAKYSILASDEGSMAVWEHLKAVDPESADAIHPNNTKRVIRALEMLEVEGVHYSEQLKGFENMGQIIPASFYYLAHPVDKLYERINARVDHMLEKGLIDEIIMLEEEGFEDALTAREAIGYKEFMPYVLSGCNDRDLLEQGVEQVKQASRRYAKRQRSWWRSDSRINIVDCEGKSIKDVCDTILMDLDKRGIR